MNSSGTILNIYLVSTINRNFRYQISPVSRTGSFDSIRTSFLIPHAIPDGEYKLYAETPDIGCETLDIKHLPERVKKIPPCRGYSRPFRILPRIFVIYPRSNVSYSTSSDSPETIWRNTYTGGFIDGTDGAVDWWHYMYGLILLKNGIEVDRRPWIDIYETTNDPESTWFSEYSRDGWPFFHHNALNGSDYQVKVELHREDKDGRSFITSGTGDYFEVRNAIDEIGTLRSDHPFTVRTEGWERGRIFQRGDTLTAYIILWGYYPDPEIQLILRLIRDRSTYERIIGEVSLPNPYPGNGRDHRIDVISWPIPPEIPSGEYYRVVAEQIGGQGYRGSSQFHFSIE